MTQFLPPNLLALFAPRDPIPYLPPAAKLAHEKKTHGYFGVGQYVHLFEDPKDTPPPTKIETREERLERKQREKLERAAYIREQGIALWDPYNNPMATSDPFKTLFVARVCPDATESKLRKEFEAYGPVKKVGLIKDKISGKPRGYAFIEFENEKDMHSAYKRADGMKIEGRRVLVDVERGRTVKGWLPRRLGGGVEDTRVRPNYREDREEKGYRDRSFDRRDRDRSNKRSRSREKDRRRRNSREREHSRDHRDHKSHREHRDRHKDRFDNGSSSKPRNRDDSKYESARGGSYGDGYSDQKFSGHSYDNDSSGYNSSSSRRHRSNRDHDRERNKRHGRSRSRSPDRSERTKRSRYNENNNGQANQMEKSDKRHYQADFDMDMAEIEEGEDRSYENDPNGGYRKSEENDYDDDYQDSYGQQQSSYA